MLHKMCFQQKLNIFQGLIILSISKLEILSSTNIATTSKVYKAALVILKYGMKGRTDTQILSCHQTTSSYEIQQKG
jgi:hypothetical protein